MFRKAIVILLSCLFLASSFYVSAEGGKIVTSDNSSDIFQEDSNTLEKYVDYEKRFADFGKAEQKISLNKDNCTAFSSGVSMKDDGYCLINANDYITYSFSVEKDGWYCPVVNYIPIESNGADIEASIMIDNVYPYSEMSNFTLPRIWKNSVDKFQIDDFGNEYSPEQVEVFEKQSKKLSDTDGFVVGNLCIALTQGTHTLTFKLTNEKINVIGIELTTPDDIPDYTDYISKHNSKKYSGENIIVEGENAFSKSSKMYIPLSNRNESSLSPSNPTVSLNNYIGGSNWNSHGGTISWKVTIPEDGLYNIGFHFHQTYLQEGTSYRRLMIDNEVPFKEAESISFRYDSGWQFQNLQNGNGEDLLVYFDKGEHTLSLSVTLGEFADFSSQLSGITARLGKIYREIVKITGESPDANRDYNLFTAIPELDNELNDISKSLKSLANESEKLSGAKGGSNAQILRKANVNIEQMLDKKYKAHTKLSSFYDNYASLCSWLYEMQNMALDIDYISFTAPDTHFMGEKVGVFKKITFSIKRLLSSFGDAYSKTSKSSDTQLVLWSNWGRDQLNILENLIANDFTPKTGIKVSLKITDASLIQAGLSGDGPDIEIHTARTNPLNYGMRGILVDLSKFSDYNEVSKWFSQTATVPYQYNGGVYGLPDTETFEMMFIRTDIFDDLGLEIPKTWDDFINVAKVITLNNMNCGMGATLSTFMTQMDVNFYKEDLSGTNLMSPGAVKAANYWLDFFTKYSFPISYSFFNRFRTGLMPMGLASYTEYSTLKAAAPEINGSWVMVEMPGFENKDGTINNTVTGAGTASVILDWSKHKDDAWTFLKWWCSEDVQYRFGVNCESVLGVSGRYPTANLNALYRLGWDNQTLKQIKGQIEALRQLPEIPGSYYVSRSIQQVQWNVVNNGENVEDMLEKWVPEADDEIRRKTEEYASK